MIIQGIWLRSFTLLNISLIYHLVNKQLFKKILSDSIRLEIPDNLRKFAKTMNVLEFRGNGSSNSCFLNANKVILAFHTTSGHSFYPG
jgi:hypothetical protein